MSIVLWVESHAMSIVLWVESHAMSIVLWVESHAMTDRHCAWVLIIYLL